jgi:hypothetical protein
MVGREQGKSPVFGKPPPEFSDSLGGAEKGLGRNPTHAEDYQGVQEPELTGEIISAGSNFFR